MKLFEFDIHIGDWRVLIQDRDIQNGAVKSRHIADGAVTTIKIGDGEVKSRHIATDAVTTDKIGDKEVKDKHIAPGAVTNEKLANECITGDEIEGNTVKNGKLANDAVQTRNIKDRNVTSSKIAKKNILLEHFAPDVIPTLKQDLQNQIDALEIAGVAVSNEFGTGPHISISQKTMTIAINKLWEKLEEITGEVYHGINMVVTPDYFISEDGATVHITASTVDANGIFENIAFYGNGALISEASNVDFFELDHHIDETTIIMCRAKILGVEYTRQQVITHYNSFWIGAGDTYQDIMDVEHIIPITEGLRGSHDVDVPEGKHIIIILGETFRNEFMRADISFAQILFDESVVTVDGKNYAVLISQDTYQAGIYNVFING